MEPQSIVIWLVIGAVAGFLAGLIMDGGGFGLIGNIIVGILGAVVAGYLFPRLGVSIPIADPIIRGIAVSAIGAVILLFVVGLFRR
ncbi:MAG: GlsB/YeaQ/YmgE family stress response membrane protein [Rhodomicrobium sp.]